MKKVLIAYFSASGVTEQMAGYIAEGVRISGREADVRQTGDIKSAAELAGYDGYIFGSPTFSLDEPAPMKTFLIMAAKAELKGKPGGAFGAYRHDVGYSHDNHAPALILEAMQKDGLAPFELGALILQQDMVGTGEGLKACQDYGRVFGEKLS